MGFVIIRRSTLEKCEGNCHSLAMDLYDQWVYMEKTTQWRFTPPTHVVAALDEAIAQYFEGGRAGGAWRSLCARLQCPHLGRACALGLRTFLDPAIQVRRSS